MTTKLHGDDVSSERFDESNAMPLKKVTPIVVLIFAAGALALPILVRSPVPFGHDTKEHLNFGQHFAEQFWQGDLYPRWLLNINYGLGSPTFFVYPPFPSYVYASFLPVARIFHLDAFILEEYICLLASGVCAFLWMTTMVSRRASLLAAALYMLLPYHLAIDFYRRGALSECWALAWMPLMLYFISQVVRKKCYATVGLALSCALLILSHLVSVFILSALPLLLALTLAERGQRAGTFLRVVGSLALGTAVSGAYLVPALANAKYFPVDRLDIPINNGPNGNLLVCGVGLFTGHSGKSGFIQAVSLATISTALFIGFCGLMVLRNGPRCRRGQGLLWLAVCPIPLFLMSGASSPIWGALPALASAVQFPWRFDVVLCIAALPLTAFLFEEMFKLPTRLRACILVIVILFAATWLAGYVETVRRLTLTHSEAAIEGHNREAKLSIHDGWFAAWTPRGMDQDSALAASTGPAARLLFGNGAVTVLVWKPRHIEVLTDCSACGPLVIKQLYYPKWQAWLVPGGQPLHVEAALPQGLLAVQTPPGRQRVLVEIPDGLDERIGNWLSALGVLGLCMFAVYCFARDRSQSVLSLAPDSVRPRSYVRSS